MTRNWLRLALVPLLGTALWVSGCTDQTTSADRLLGPDAASFAKDPAKEAERAAEKAAKKAEKEAKKKRREEQRAAIKPVKGKLPVGEYFDTKVIGENGGELKVAGHMLVVPEDAVEEKTLFTMRVFQESEWDVLTGERLVTVGVQLRAIGWDCDGDGRGEKHSFKKGCEEVDVGVQGFAEPVELRLTYDWATNVGETDELGIYWVKNSKVLEFNATTVDRKKKFASAFLDHFSDYLLAMP